MLAALGCGVIATAGPARAAGDAWNGSYAADGACHCVGELDPSVAAREVDTPTGRRSIARACEAAGVGPGLQFDGDAFDRTVYPDVQCGNGPFASGVELLDAECAGTRRPGEADCRPVGPRWRMGAAPAAAARPAPAATATATATASTSAAASGAPVRTVEVDGRAWRKAPAGTPRSGGRPGSRIILDDELYLRADDPRFARADRATEEARRAALRAAAATREVEYASSATTAAPAAPAASSAPTRTAALDADGRPWREAPAEPVEPIASAESPEALRERQRALVAERRRREADAASVASAPVDAPSRRAPEEPATLAAALPDEPEVDAVADTGPAVDESAEAVAATAPGEASAQDAAPLGALRLPAEVRGSSSEFGYVEAMPKSYEIGGAGIGLEASGEAARRFHYGLRVGAASSYREVALGAGVHVTPPDADRLTFALTGGVEYGTFELVGTDDEGREVLRIDDEEVGGFVEVSTRLVVNPRFELSGGVGYSSFHGGDPHGFGGAFFHVNRRLDILSRFEVGDNDQLGIGLRYYY